MARLLRLAERTGALSRGVNEMSRVQTRALNILMDEEEMDARADKERQIKIALLTANPSMLLTLFPEYAPVADTEDAVNQAIDKDDPATVETTMSADEAIAFLKHLKPSLSVDDIRVAVE